MKGKYSSQEKGKKLPVLVGVTGVLVLLLLGLTCCQFGGNVEPTEATEVTEATVEMTEATEVTMESTEATEEVTEPATEAPEATEEPSKAPEVHNTDNKPDNKPDDKPTTPSKDKGNGGGKAPEAPTEAPATEPPATEEPAPAPTEHTHSYSISATTPATCTKEGSNTYACSCGDSYTEAIPVVEHSWQHVDEVSHDEAYYVCHCGGWRFHVTYDGEDPTFSFAEHKFATGNLEDSYYFTSVHVVDSEARDYCAVCGTPKT